MNLIFQNCQQQTVPHESTAQYLSFEWSHNRVSSTHSKVRTTFIDPRFDSGSERVKHKGTEVGEAKSLQLISSYTRHTCW